MRTQHSHNYFTTRGLQPKSNSKLFYARQSVGHSVLVSGHYVGPVTSSFFFHLNYIYTIAGVLLWDALSDERMGL
jgi:hypothetical protein